ncbi:MAG: hypothetical protein MK186_12095, partial [Henriciella sp.]|nr:hypothetical protein [Henriciella sp.]
MSANEPHPGNLQVIPDGDNHAVLIAGYVENDPTVLENTGRAHVCLQLLGCVPVRLDHHVMPLRERPLRITMVRQFPELPQRPFRNDSHHLSLTGAIL